MKPFRAFAACFLVLAAVALAVPARAQSTFYDQQYTGTLMRP